MKAIFVVISRIIVIFLSLTLTTGCTQLKAIFGPTRPPSAPIRPARPAARPVRPAPPPESAPAPESTPAPHQEAPPRLAPQVSSGQEKQLTEEINATIHEVERILLSINQRKLKADQAEMFQTVQSFLSQAREALGNKDFQQAMNLAQKAHVLSGELSTSVH